MADTSTKSNTVTTTASSSRMDLQKWDTLRHQRRLQSRSAANKSQCNGSLFRMGPKLSATATYRIIPLHSRDTCQTQSRCLKVWVVTDAAGIMHVGHLSTRMASQAAKAVQAQDPMCAAPVCSLFPFFLQYNSCC